MKLTADMCSLILFSVEGSECHEFGRLEISNWRRESFVKLIPKTGKVVSIFPLPPDLIWGSLCQGSGILQIFQGAYQFYKIQLPHIKVHHIDNTASNITPEPEISNLALH